MAEIEGETLNEIFDELANWEEQLKYVEPELLVEESHEIGGPEL